MIKKQARRQRWSLGRRYFYAFLFMILIFFYCKRFYFPKIGDMQKVHFKNSSFCQSGKYKNNRLKYKQRLKFEQLFDNCFFIDIC